MKEYDDRTDIIELIEWADKNIPIFGRNNLKFTHHGVYSLLQHPHKAIRWLTILNAPNKFMPIIEHHYYKEKKDVVRVAIAKRTKNIKLLRYIMKNEKSDKIKRMVMSKYSHILINTINEERK